MAREIVSNKNIANGYAGLDGGALLYSSQIPTNFLTTQSNQAVSAANGSSTFQTLSLANSNGVSFSTGTQGVYASVNTSYAASNHSHGNPTLNLTNLSGTTASASNGLTLSLSGHPQINIATQVYDVASAGSTGTVTRYAPEDHRHAGVFRMAAGSNVGTTLGDTAAKHGEWVIAVSGNGTMSGSTGAGGVHTAWISIPNAAASPVGVSAGTTSSNLATINFADSNGVSFGLNGATITASVNTSYAASNHSHGNPTLNLTNLSGTTASNSAGFTLSLSAAAAGGGYTRSGYNPYMDIPMVTGQVGQGSLQFEPECFPDFQFDRVCIPLLNTNSSNSSGSHTVSMWLGIYTRNASSISLAGSVSTSLAVTHSGTAGSYSLYSGIRLVTLPWTTTLTAGDYWIGFASRTTSGGANGTYSNMLGSNYNSNFLGFWSSSHNTTQQFTLGQGVYSATTSGMPNSVAFSQIRGSDSIALRAPMVLFASSTV